MTAVKGSKQYQLEVVPYRPLQRWMLRLGALVVALLAVWGAHSYGTYKALQFQQQSLGERDQFEIALVQSRAEVESLRQEVANLRLGSTVDQAASEDVRNEVISLKTQIAELQEDITFYRGLMMPSADNKGLVVGSLNVISSGTARRFNYKLVVQQLATNHQVMSGNLTFTIVGRQGEVPMSLALKDVSTSVDSTNIRLGFKYFQNIEGELELPEGFEPLRIEIVASVRTPSAAKVEKKFGWLAEERL